MGTSKPNLLLVVQNVDVVSPYKVLFEDSFSDIYEYILSGVDDFLKIDTSKYNIVLIDIISKKYLDNVTSIKNINNSKSKIILIAPYSLNTIYNSTRFLEFFNLVLSKPIDVPKLMTYIKTQSSAIERKNILEQKNHILAKVVELYPSRIAVYNMQSLLVYANMLYLDANGLKTSDIDRLKYDEIIECNIGFDEIKHKLEISKSFAIQRQDNDKWYESVFYMVEYEYVIHVCSDITIQKQKEIQLEQSAVFFENSNEGIVITDSRGIIRSVNKSFCKITGYSKEEAIGQTPAILNSGIHDKNFYEHMWDSLKNNNSWQGEIWNRRKNGEIYPEWLSIAKALNPKYNEEFYIAIFTDITNLKDADKKLYYYANHDLLTGLANRVQFESYLKNAIASTKRHNSKLALFFIDLDKFKDINDTYGHTIGDHMLQSVAKRLQKSLRQEDFIARIGGDEFVLVAKDVKNPQDMEYLAIKLADAIKEPIRIEDKIFFMTLSIGIAIYPDDGDSAEDIIKNADAAMYVVKENGRNGYMLYHKDMTNKVKHKLNIQNELKFAIEQDQFEMYYQSIIDLKSNQIVGAEALIRWKHPSRGILSPVEFLDFIYDSSMTLDFGVLVVKKVFADMHIINNVLKNKNFKVAINISPRQFFQENFTKDLKQLCDDFGIIPSQIEIELLETSVMHNHIIAQNKFEELKNLGFYISIDDFGTGYSSLSYLKNFKVDKLKIDQSFIRDFLEDNNDKSIVEAIIKLGKTFDMAVQAEGVETLEHENVLNSLNCDFAQGYYYNKPNDILSFLEFVNNWGSKCKEIAQ